MLGCGGEDNLNHHSSFPYRSYGEHQADLRSMGFETDLMMGMQWFQKQIMIVGKLVDRSSP